MLTVIIGREIPPRFFEDPSASAPSGAGSAARGENSSRFFDFKFRWLERGLKDVEDFSEMWNSNSAKPQSSIVLINQLASG